MNAQSPLLPAYLLQITAAPSIAASLLLKYPVPLGFAACQGVGASLAGACPIFLVYEHARAYENEHPAGGVRKVAARALGELAALFLNGAAGYGILYGLTLWKGEPVSVETSAELSAVSIGISAAASFVLYALYSWRQAVRG